MKLNKQFFIDTLGWGLILWGFGYLLGIILFFIVPKSMIGWIITPLASALTLWILIKKINTISIGYYFQIAITWTLLAVILDYFLIVKAFKPEDGYYKPDVYLYYALTFILPLIVALIKKNKAL